MDDKTIAWLKAKHAKQTVAQKLPVEVGLKQKLKIETIPVNEPVRELTPEQVKQYDALKPVVVGVKKMGRPPLNGDRAMSKAEYQKRWRAKKRTHDDG